jgi:hypothetical protein
MTVITDLARSLFCCYPTRLPDDGVRVDHAHRRDSPVNGNEHPAIASDTGTGGTEGLSATLDEEDLRTLRDLGAESGERSIIGYALQCGKDDKAFALLQTASVDNICAAWDQLVSWAKRRGGEQTRALMMRACDFLLHDVPRRNFPIEVYARILDKFAHRAEYLSADSQRGLQVDIWARLPDNLFELCLRLPHDVAKPLFSNMHCTSHHLVYLDEIGHLSRNLTPEFMRVRYRLWVCNTSFHGGPAGLVQWASENAPQETAAGRIIECAFKHQYPDETDRIEANKLDFKGLGLTNMFHDMHCIRWVQRLDLSDNQFTHLPEILFDLKYPNKPSQRCEIDLRGNPLELSPQQWSRMIDPSRTGPVFIVDPEAIPEGAASAASATADSTLAALPKWICDALEVGKHATAKEIRGKRNQLALKYHDDKKGGSTQQMQQINVAFDAAKKYRPDLT